jgi:hypothetical protein
MGISINRILPYSLDEFDIHVDDIKRYNHDGVHFSGFVRSDDIVPPIEKFARKVPENTEWLIAFEDNVGEASPLGDSNSKATCLYSAKGVALILKDENERQ